MEFPKEHSVGEEECCFTTSTPTGSPPLSLDLLFNSVESLNLLSKEEDDDSPEASSSTSGIREEKFAQSEESEQGPSFERKETNSFQDAIISREQWRAKRPRTNLQWPSIPFRFVIINFYDVRCGISSNECIYAIREMQEDDMMFLDDIACNFTVGRDCLVYEGRGWYSEWKPMVLQICFLRNKLDDHPCDEQLATCRRLIQEGVRLGKISMDYRLNAFPVNKLYYEVMKWEHFQNLRCLDSM